MVGIGLFDEGIIHLRCVRLILFTKLRKMLVSNECSAQMQTYLPIQLFTFFPGFSGHSTTTRVGVFVCHLLVVIVDT